jgi:diaminohydroxyphosphoribosylaminopyrimidine deaminase/5-amino-6-(5-phosphoribosylamino)uracil reductase
MSGEFSAEDHARMARALELAARGLYSTPPNPSVGCVIVRDGQVLGEGFHQRAGEAHAEVIALQAAGVSARGSTAYVSLEPCAHRGRTPPCVEALIAAGVSRVVAATGDPNPSVNGGGLARLAAAGIEVQCGLLEAAAIELNRGFLSRMRRGRPWVTLKTAASLDGRTALASGESRWITGPAARADVQRLRARSSAILTGIGTVCADDPELTVRDESLAMLGRRPLRVVLDPGLRIPRQSKLLQGPAPTLVFAAEAIRGNAVGGAGPQLRLETLPAGDGGLDLGAALARLAALECNEVLVEAGPLLAGSLLRAGLVDEWVLYLAAVVLGDAARPLARLPELHSMRDRWQFQWRDLRQVGEDLRLTLRPQRGGQG